MLSPEQLMNTLERHEMVMDDYEKWLEKSLKNKSYWNKRESWYSLKCSTKLSVKVSSEKRFVESLKPTETFLIDYKRLLVWTWEYEFDISRNISYESHAVF